MTQYHARLYVPRLKSFAPPALALAPPPALIEDRLLVARARRLAGVDGRGETGAVGLANRPLARWAVHVTIGAQANQCSSAGLRRAVRVVCVGVALREEARRGESIASGAHERVESGLVAALGVQSG